MYDKSVENMEKKQKELTEILITMRNCENNINMSLISLSDEDAKQSVEAAMVPLRDGICSLNKVYESLIDADVDPIIGQCSNSSSIREHIVEAQQSLEKSEQQASAGLKSLDQNIEKLTEEEGKLEKEKRDAKHALDNLKTEQTSNEKLLRDSQSYLSQARSNLSSSRDVLERQKNRRKKAEVVTKVGVGLFAIPVVGWIAGAGMVIGGAIEMDEASNAIREAEDEVRKSESHVDTYRRKVSHCESKISQTKNNIMQKRDKVQQIRKGIQKAKEKKVAVSDFQFKVRRAVSILSSLTGRASVTKHQTSRFILKEPVMKVMEEVIKATEDVAGNQLLHTKGILSLIEAMRKNGQKLAAICTARSKNKKRRVSGKKK